MNTVIALVGLSGVGKSTLVRHLQPTIPLLHLQASELIKAEQARRSAVVSSSEELRLGPVIDNQQLLIEGFNAAIESASGLVIFDGHTVIFAEKSATKIPSEVFRAIRCAAVVVVEADPAVIRAQRKNDAGRPRPDLDEAALDRQQSYAKGAALQIAAELSIPCHSVRSGDTIRLAEIFKQL